MPEVRGSVCALDCPDCCALLVNVEDGRGTRLRGDPEHPVTRGFLCGKVARYLEREAHEMYGIEFTGNDDLRPILLYEGFAGHPLRKDYPIDMEQSRFSHPPFSMLVLCTNK